MRTALLVAAAVVAVLVLWLVSARYLVLALDAVTTSGETKTVSGPLVAGMGSISVGETPLDLAPPGAEPRNVHVDVENDGRVVLTMGDKIFVLGRRAAETVDVLPIETPFKPEPGDQVTFRFAHSVLPWPTPLDINFMTGNSPSWKRNTYYTLTWTKADGQRLELTWRFEQWYYDDWASPQMINEGTCGLIRVRIS